MIKYDPFFEQSFMNFFCISVELSIYKEEGKGDRKNKKMKEARKEGR